MQNEATTGLASLHFETASALPNNLLRKNSFLIQNLYQRRLFAVLFKTNSNPNDHKLNKTHIHRDDAPNFPANFKVAAPRGLNPQKPAF